MPGAIAETLREKLFDRPAPPRREWEFAAVAADMFPRRAQFLTFLDERHFEQQIESAKHILLRLAYQSPYSPPNKFLYNLLDTESRLAGAAPKAAFSGRDHFVHLVNLYLLGLYVFWYHDGLHRHVRQQFAELAPDNHDVSRLEKRITACRAFVAAWRDFVLFHDLGYPWEVAAGLDNPAAALRPFVQVARYAGKDAALFALSQLLALEWIRQEEQPAHFGKELEPYIGRPPAAQRTLFGQPDRAFRERWAGAERLPSTSDSGLLRLVAEIVPEDDRISVLETASEGYPVASTNPTLRQLLPTRTRNVPDDDLSDPERLQHFASRNEVPVKAREQFRWAHYVLDFERHLNAFVAALFGRHAKQVRPFLADFLKTFPPEIPLAPEAVFDDYAYALYHRLLEALDFDRLDHAGPGTLVVYDRIAQSEVAGLQRLLLGEVGGALRAMLEEHALTLERTGTVLTKMQLGDYLEKLLDVLVSRRDLARQVEHSLNDQVKERIQLKGQLYELYKVLKNAVAEDVAAAAPPLFTQRGEGPVFEGAADWEAFAANQLAAGVEALLSERGLSGIDTLIAYQPEWLQKQRVPVAVFMDHGLAAGLLYAQVVQGWRALADGATPLRRLVRLRGAVDQQVAAPMTDRHPAHEVLYTIFIHNLYPSSFRDAAHRAFRTKYGRKDTFSYFALLCDSLQPWDRKRLFNPATGSPPYTTYAESFNLEVHGNVLRISERGDQLRIDERQAALRGYLNSYLQQAAELVKLHLSEWK